MKSKRNILIAVLFLILISLVFNIFFESDLFEYTSFIVGFLTSLVIVSLYLFFVKRRNKNLSENKSNRIASKYSFSNTLLIILIVAVSIVGSMLIFKQKKIAEWQSEIEKNKIAQQSELVKSIKQGNLIVLMSDILNQVNTEMKEPSNDSLSEETINRIAALSYSFKPYRSIEGEIMTGKMLSSERGQLLLSLSKMNIDSASFSKIVLRTSFSNVDLKGADLRRVNLTGADLRGANFREANLEGAKLSGADLKDADLWGANLKKANLAGAKLNRADLGWAELNEVDLKKAILNGVNMTSARLKKSDLTDVELKWANCRGAFFNKANLSGVNLYGTTLEKANLNAANLSTAKLLYSNLSEASLEGANMSEVNLIIAGVKEENWLNKLSDWNVIGAEEIRKKYKIEIDKSKRTNYHLKKIIN